MSRRHAAGPGRRWARRRAGAMDRALERTLQERGVSPDEFGPELWAAQVLDASAEAEAPPPEALTVLRAALAAREARDRPVRRITVRQLVPVVPGAVAALVVGLVAYVGVGGGQRLQPGQADQLAVARSLDQVDQRMALVVSRIAAGQLSGADTTVQQLRDALLRVEQAAGGLDPGDPGQQALLASLYREIAMLNSLVARLHLRVEPLPTPVGYLGSVSAGPPTSAPLPDSTTTTCSALNPARNGSGHGSSMSSGWGSSGSTSSGSGSSPSGSSASGASGSGSSGSGSSGSGSGSSPAGLGTAPSVAEPGHSSTTTTSAPSSSSTTTSTTSAGGTSASDSSRSSTTTTNPLSPRPYGAKSTTTSSSSTTTGAAPASGSRTQAAPTGGCGTGGGAGQG